MQQFCRLCLLKIPDANFVTLNNEDAKAREVRTELSACVPKVQHNLVKDPIICSYCVSVLNVTYNFKTQCCDVESRIERLKQNQQDELYKVSMSCDISTNCNVPAILKVKEEYVSDEEERTKICCTSLSHKVSTVVTKSVVPIEQRKEQHYCQYVVTNIKVIEGLIARYEELTGSTSVSSGVCAYTINKHENPQEMNTSCEEIIIKEEHEPETLELEQFCRLCLLKIPDANIVTLNNEDAKVRDVQTELSACLPELQADLVKDSVICSFCVSVLHLMYTFRTQCFNVERKIRGLQQNMKISVEDFTLTELYNMSMTCNSQNNSLIELFSRNCNAPEVLNVKEECVSDEEETRNACSTSLPYKVPNIVMKSDLPMEQTQQNDGQNLTANIKVITGSSTHHEKLTRATSVSSSVDEYTVNKHEISEEMNNTDEEFIVKEEHELETFKTEESNTEKKPFRCNICEFRTAQRCNLKPHIRTHTGEKPFVCTICEFRCGRRTILNQHMKIHTGEKPFRCTLCDFRTAQQGNLKSHMRTHTKEKPFACRICEFRCSQQITLNQHIRTHTGEKPFRCNICEFCAAAPSNLARHMKTHSGEKPFACTICEFRTVQRSYLKTHIRTHTGMKPFQCDICEHRTVAKHALTRHMKIHNREKPRLRSVSEVRSALGST